MIMRAEGVYRVILNTPVFKDMNFGGPGGVEPTGKSINLGGLEDGKVVPLLLKVCEEICIDFVDLLTAVSALMRKSLRVSITS